MRRKSWIALLVIAFAAVAYMLWTRFQVVDFAIEEHVQKAEEERHQLVISHDFDHLKEELIEVHRDYWIAVARQEQQARIEAIGLGALLLLLGLFAARELRSGK